MPPIPFKEEPLTQLQARYPKCLEKFFDQDAIEHHGATRPGQLPEHCFDFDDGLRLLISREKRHDGTIALHVSASFQDECKIADEFRLLMVADSSREKRWNLLRMWAKSIPARWAELAQDKGPLIELIGFSGSMIPHFSREERPSI